MRAALRREWGGPISVEELPDPVAGPGTVIVRPRFASVNALDWHTWRGTPYLMRFGEGLRRPAEPQLGADFAGVVEAIGDDVTSVSPGDEVLGMGARAFADLVRVKAEGVVAKPPGVSFEQAAAVPVAGITALQGLRDHGGLRPGDSVLVFGAGGGVGSMAVQLARVLGAAAVTAVTSAAKAELVASLGPDRVLDYASGEPFGSGERFDLVLDASGVPPLRALASVASPGRPIVTIGGGQDAAGSLLGPFARVLRSRVLGILGTKYTFFLGERRTEDLRFLADRLAEGSLRIPIERSYPLAEAADAIARADTGQVAGKLLVSIP